MVKITDSAISEIKNEVSDIIEKGKKPFIRLEMAIG